MYENGGNTTHRFLDGHPQMFVYPFESQLGTRLVTDHLTSTFPVKYRWPVFPLDGTPAGDYRMIIDEEGKVRSRTPFVSKFRDYPFGLSDDDRRRRYVEFVNETGRSTGNNVAAFFRATFEAWTDVQRSGREVVYVGYSPIVVVDAERILRDLPNAHVLHIVRNPWSAFADTSKRPVPLSLEDYLLGWVLNQQHALMFKALHPDRIHVLRIEDVMADPKKELGSLCGTLGLEVTDTLSRPSWNGRTLEQVYPWGTIRTPTLEANRATAMELSPSQRDEIRVRAGSLLDDLDYRTFI
jgi:hypothetical protein